MQWFFYLILRCSLVAICGIYNFGFVGLFQTLLGLIGVCVGAPQFGAPRYNAQVPRYNPAPAPAQPAFAAGPYTTPIPILAQTQQVNTDGSYQYR